MIVIGIDPGKNTGVARWDVARRMLTRVTSMPVHEAFAMITLERPALVVFEDARQRSWFGRMDFLEKKYGRGVREGAGAAKRDAAIWERFLLDAGVPFIAKKPCSGTTKWSSEKFRALTKWLCKTNEHGRDAAMLVFGLTLPMVNGMLRNYSDARTRAEQQKRGGKGESRSRTREASAG